MQMKFRVLLINSIRMAKIIIGLVGEMASGKEVTKNYLAEKFGAKHCKFSTPLRDVMNRLCIDISRDNMIDISTLLRERFGLSLLFILVSSIS